MDASKEFSDKQPDFEIKAIQSKIFSHDQKVKSVIKKSKRDQRSPIRIPARLPIVRLEYGGPEAFNRTGNSFKSSPKPQSSFHDTRNAGWNNSYSPNQTFYEQDAIKLSPSNKNITKIDQHKDLRVQSQQKKIINKDILQTMFIEREYRNKKKLGEVEEK